MLEVLLCCLPFGLLCSDENSYRFINEFEQNIPIETFIGLVYDEMADCQWLSFIIC